LIQIVERNAHGQAHGGHELRAVAAPALKGSLTKHDAALVQDLRARTKPGSLAGHLDDDRLPRPREEGVVTKTRDDRLPKE
jgi:hypothetical protein